MVWLFCSDAANVEINRTHKRCLRVLYQDYDSSFQLLLSRDSSQTVHVKNLQKLMTDIYKSMKKWNPSYLWKFHERKDITYDLRTKDLCKLPKINKRNGSESLSFREVFSGTHSVIKSNKNSNPCSIQKSNKIVDW